MRRDVPGCAKLPAERDVAVAGRTDNSGRIDGSRAAHRTVSTNLMWLARCRAAGPPGRTMLYFAHGERLRHARARAVALILLAS
jgi:hypothetical protein